MKATFILGNPRSGTSLFRLMLNSHPQIVSPPECGFLHWWSKKYQDWTKVDGESDQILNCFINDLFMSKKIETWDLDRSNLKNFLKQSVPQTYGALTQAIYVYWGLQRGKQASVIADKNNYYVNHLGDIHEVWPDATFLVIVRDGRDVACSYKEIEKLSSSSPYKPKLPSGIREIAKEWEQNNLRMMEFLSSNVTAGSYMVVKYEELISRPEALLTSVCEFLGVAFSERMLEYYKYNDEPTLTIDWKKKTLEKLDLDNIGKFRQILTPDEIADFNETAMPSLKLFGYE